jgi:hypothetical protein
VTGADVAGVGPLYSVDSCALIDLKDLYPRARFPRLWDLFATLADDRRLRICRQSRDECKDEVLVDFLKEHSGAFVDLDEFEPFLVWLVRAQGALGIEVTAPSRTSTDADPFIIALALQLDGRSRGDPSRPNLTGPWCHVLTSEKRNPGLVRRQMRKKIPDICDVLGLRCVTLLDIMRDEEYSG